MRRKVGQPLDAPPEQCQAFGCLIHFFMTGACHPSITILISGCVVAYNRSHSNPYSLSLYLAWPFATPSAAYVSQAAPRQFNDTPSPTNPCPPPTKHFLYDAFLQSCRGAYLETSHHRCTCSVSSRVLSALAMSEIIANVHHISIHGVLALEASPSALRDLAVGFG